LLQAKAFIVPFCRAGINAASSARNRQLADRSELMRALVPALLTVALIAGAIVLRDVLPKPPERYLVIHADDAGMYPSVNAATIEALERGTVSSCSIMVPCPAFAEFANYAAAKPERDFGIHLTLNCDTDSFRWGPVSAKQKVPSLLDPDGFFWKTTQETAQHAKIDEAEMELRAQIDKAHAAGIRVSHLDHHMFVLFQRADLLRLYVRLSLDYNIPIRYVQHLSAEVPFADDPEIITAYREGVEKLRSRGMPVFNDIDSRSYDLPPEQKRRHYLAALPNLKPGVTEFIIHCAYGPVGPMHAPNADRREADLRVFTSEEMREWICRCGVVVIDWRTFREITVGGRLR
jgi:hypothetical protein